MLLINTVFGIHKKCIRTNLNDWMVAAILAFGVV